MTQCEKVFNSELGSIKDAALRIWVIDVFDKIAPEKFWKMSASTSGKWHPKISSGVGGLVKHTKLAVYWGRKLYEAMPTEGFAIDEVIASLLLHDIGKGWLGDTRTHGVNLAQKLREQHLSVSSTTELIIYGIESHMGIWTCPEVLGPGGRKSARLRDFCLLVHLADYCASRKVDGFMEKLAQL